MRRLVLARFVCLFVFLLFLPVPAHALFWHWLDELSGPGGFNGYEIEVRLVCFSKPEDPKAQEIKEVKIPKTAAAMIGAIPPGCVFTRVPLRNRRTASINLNVSYNYANHTNLQYDDDRTHYVHLLIISPRVWLRPTRSVEVGAGIGWYRFTGAGFDPISRVVFEPFLVDVKPFALIKDVFNLSDQDDVRTYPDSQWDQFISVRVGLVYTEQGFDAERFGARPGTFRTDREVLPTASVLLDLDWLVRRLKRPCPC